jgi:hypothetical protein
MFPALGAVLGLLHPVAGGVLRRGLKFQICTNTLNIFFNSTGDFWVPQCTSMRESDTTALQGRVPFTLAFCLRHASSGRMTVILSILQQTDVYYHIFNTYNFN